MNMREFLKLVKKRKGDRDGEGRQERERWMVRERQALWPTVNQLYDESPNDSPLRWEKAGHGLLELCSALSHHTVKSSWTSIQFVRGVTQWAPLQRAQWSLWIHRETCRMNRALSKLNKTRETYESHCLPITQTRTLKCYTPVYNCWKSCSCKYRKTCCTQMSKQQHVDGTKPRSEETLCSELGRPDTLKMSIPPNGHLSLAQFLSRC